MEDSPRKPRKEQEEEEEKHRLSSSSNGSTNSSSEFEFWMTRNTYNIPQPEELISADELFLDGVMLPLQLLHTHGHPPNPSISSLQLSLEKKTPLATDIDNTITGSVGGGSKGRKMVACAQDDERVEEKDRDKDKDDEKKEKRNGREKEKKKKKGHVSSSCSGNAELNIINLWPFRSRSSGNDSIRPKWVPLGLTRQVSSAPCSRSNSSGENKSGRKWPTSPGRVNGGVYLGRTSPVWQVRSNGSSSNSKLRRSSYCEPVVRSIVKGGGGKKEFTVPGCSNNNDNNSSNKNNSDTNNKAKILNLNVPRCIGHRSHHLSCRNDANSARIVDSGGDLRGKNGDNSSGRGLIGRGSGGGHLFNLRSLFTKKVY